MARKKKLNAAQLKAMRANAAKARKARHARRNEIVEIPLEVIDAGGAGSRSTADDAKLLGLLIVAVMQALKEGS